MTGLLVDDVPFILLLLTRVHRETAFDWVLAEPRQVRHRGRPDAAITSCVKSDDESEEDDQ